MRRNFQAAPIVFTFQAACPYCGSPEATRTDQQRETDGTLTRFLVCNSCSRLYRNVVESFPIHESGIWVDWLGYVPPNDEPTPEPDEAG